MGGAQSIEKAQREGLWRMRAIALSMLLLMAAVYVLSVAFGLSGYVRAFSEAAMVGAIADWFAVTALFRRPLNLPFPHTAIIPNSKERIGRNLGIFVREYLFTPKSIIKKLEEIDVPEKVALWLIKPENNKALAGDIAYVLRESLRMLDDERLRASMKEGVRSYISGVKAAPAMGSLFEILTANRRHQELLDKILARVQQVFEENKGRIRVAVREHSWWFIPSFVDEMIYDKIVEAADKFFREAKDNPEHEVRRRFDEAIAELVERLKNSPELYEKGEQLKQEILDNPTVLSYFDSLWDAVTGYLMEDLSKDDSSLRRHIEGILFDIAASLLKDDERRSRLNRYLKRLTFYTVTRHGEKITHFIEEEVRRWDTEYINNKVELFIGKDLQYIRLNGTVVGGFTGLIIYAVTEAVS